MDFQLKSLRLAEAAAAKAPALVVLVAEGFQPGADALSALIQRATEGGDFKAEAGKLLASYGSAGVAAERVVLAGIGDGRPARVRKAVAAALGALKGGPAKALTLCFAQGPAPDAVGAAVQAAADAAYVYTATKGKDARKDQGALKQVTVAVPDAAAARGAFAQAVGIAEGVRMAREWANRPANHATPTMLGEAARALAKSPRVACEVLGPKEVAKLGMGAFRAVAQGSEQELRFIVLRYGGAKKDAAPVVLVGKGITFDTGGISLKPAAEMDEMKFDMGGAASVLGVFRALAEALQAAGEQALDPCWRLPLDDEYAEGLKTNFADVANVAGRAAGAVTAAKFLQRFTKAYPWAHLDIAGTAWKGGAAKGATGRPVGLLVNYLLGQAKPAKPGAKAARKPAKPR